MARVFIGVGSNIDPEANIRHALQRLAKVITLKAISMFYCTAPVGNAGQTPFYNGVVEVESDLPPVALKYTILRRIEEELGRVRTLNKDASRAIDLDMLIYDELLLASEDLVLPDPLIQERPFVAIPLCELAPSLRLPDTEQSICDIAHGMDRQGMEALPEYTAQLREVILHE